MPTYVVSALLRANCWPFIRKFKMGIAAFFLISLFLQPLLSFASQATESEFQPTTDSLEFVVNAAKHVRQRETRFHSPMAVVPPPREIGLGTPFKPRLQGTITLPKASTNAGDVEVPRPRQRLSKQEYRQILSEMRARVRARENLPMVTSVTANPPSPSFAASELSVSPSKAFPDKPQRPLVPNHLLPIHESVHGDGYSPTVPKAVVTARNGYKPKKPTRGKLKSETFSRGGGLGEKAGLKTGDSDANVIIMPVSAPKAIATPFPESRKTLPRESFGWTPPHRESTARFSAKLTENSVFTKQLQRMQMRETKRQEDAARLGIVLPSQGGQFPSAFPSLGRLHAQVRQILVTPTIISFEYRHDLVDSLQGTSQQAAGATGSSEAPLASVGLPYTYGPAIHFNIACEGAEMVCAA